MQNIIKRTTPEHDTENGINYAPSQDPNKMQQQLIFEQMMQQQSEVMQQQMLQQDRRDSADTDHDLESYNLTSSETGTPRLTYPDLGGFLDHVDNVEQYH
jgi:hypothetical protein